MDRIYNYLFQPVIDDCGNSICGVGRIVHTFGRFIIMFLYKRNGWLDGWMEERV